MSQGFDKYSDSVGHLVMKEDGAITNSGGDMSNDEHLADKLTSLLHTALRAHQSNTDIANTAGFKRLAVIWEDFVYVLTVSDHKIYAVKKRYVSPEA